MGLASAPLEPLRPPHRREVGTRSADQRVARQDGNPRDDLLRQRKRQNPPIGRADQRAAEKQEPCEPEVRETYPPSSRHIAKDDMAADPMSAGRRVRRRRRALTRLAMALSPADLRRHQRASSFSFSIGRLSTKVSYSRAAKLTTEDPGDQREPPFAPDAQVVERIELAGEVTLLQRGWSRPASCGCRRASPIRNDSGIEEDARGGWPCERPPGPVGTRDRNLRARSPPRTPLSSRTLVRLKTTVGCEMQLYRRSVRTIWRCSNG